MRLLVGVTACLLVLLVEDAAAASAIVVYDDGTPAPVLQAWVDASFVPVPPGVVTVHRVAVCALNRPACTRAPGDEVWLQVPARELRPTLSHELGHRFDYLRMSIASRRAFCRLIGDRRPWRSSPNSCHEQFAEAYGLCFRRRQINARMGTGGYGYLPTRTTHRRACRLIRQADRDVFG